MSGKGKPFYIGVASLCGHSITKEIGILLFNMGYINRTYAIIKLIFLIFLPKLDTLEAQPSKTLETKTGRFNCTTN